MRSVRWIGLALLLVVPSAGWAVHAPKRLLLVTHSGGFMHDSIHVAEGVLKEIGPKNGFEVTCWRYTADPDAKVDNKPALASYSEKFRKSTGEKGKPGEEVTKAHCGRINAETLKDFDAVLFFTTGSRKSPPAPLTDAELADLIQWVENGGAFAGTHCGADTLYDTAYGDLLGAFFQTHPPGFQKIKVHVEDPKHPAAQGFTDGMPYEDEMYIFQDKPYSRDRLHVILSIEKGSFNPASGKRGDGDYAISWCREQGKGKIFYTSLGHRREVWRDPRFQSHLMGGLKWATGLAPGDATPSAKLGIK
jgi:type 1 glutamine amidotransferase